MNIEQINKLTVGEIRTLRRNAETNQSNVFVFPHLLADGQTRWVEVHSSPIEVANAKVLFSIVNDITERIRLEEQLRQTQKLEAIGTLAGGIAHDFNNILFAILGNADLATSFIPKDNPAQENVRAISTAGQRAAGLVRQILTFARRADKRVESIEVAVIASEVSKLLRATLPTTIAINLRIDTNRTTVMADPTEIHQVLMNLCTNAGQAMSARGGTLEIALASIDADEQLIEQHPQLQAVPHLVLSISDTGPGMAAGVQGRIFEPFYTTKTNGEGTGMGLAVVHGIINDLRGAISVYSEVGQGAVFRVYLPLAGTDASPVAVTLNEIPGGLERVLVVDDEPALAKVLQDMLAGLGYTVEVLNSSEQALAVFLAAPERYDLVITDQTMPRLTGAELAEQVLARHPRQPIILCTGFSHTMSQEKASQIGIAAYITKPISRRELARTIRRVLDGA